MAFRRYRGAPRKRSSRTFGASLRYRNVALSAKYTATEEFRDGEDATTSINPAVNTTNSLLLLGSADFGMNSTRQTARLMFLDFRGLIAPSESANQSGHIDWVWWLAMMSSREQTDWITNNRDINDNLLYTTANAAPFRILRHGLVAMRADKNNVTSLSYPAAWPARIRCSVKRPVTVPYPMNLYMFFKPVIVDDFSGSWASGEVSLTWNMTLKVQKPNDT